MAAKPAGEPGPQRQKFTSRKGLSLVSTADISEVGSLAAWIEQYLQLAVTGVRSDALAEEETCLLLIEQTGTPNTGDPETAAPRRLL